MIISLLLPLLLVLAMKTGTQKKYKYTYTHIHCVSRETISKHRPNSIHISSEEIYYMHSYVYEFKSNYCEHLI